MKIEAIVMLSPKKAIELFNLVLVDPRVPRTLRIAVDIDADYTEPDVDDIKRAITYELEAIYKAPFFFDNFNVLNMDDLLEELTPAEDKALGTACYASLMNS